MRTITFSLKVLILLMFIQGCSGNGFQLRKSEKLDQQFSKTTLEGETLAPRFETIITDAISEAGGEVIETAAQAQSAIVFHKFEEGRRIIAYTSERTAREYLVFLKIEYSIVPKQSPLRNSQLASKRRIHIDRSYLYDSDFALGKSEEEKRVKKTLYEEAARLILLRLKYSK